MIKPGIVWKGDLMAGVEQEPVEGWMDARVERLKDGTLVLEVEYDGEWIQPQSILCESFVPPISGELLAKLLENRGGNMFAAREKE